jgi:peptide deformylase
MRFQPRTRVACEGGALKVRLAFRMALNLIPESDPVLRDIAKPIADYGSRRLLRLAGEMEDLRAEECALGLAAPQVGVSERIIVVEIPDDDFVGIPETYPVPATVLVNPEIVWETEQLIKLPEGCLSLCGMMGNVLRPSRIQVEARDVEGNPFSIMADGWLARVLQHEIDHLDGILYPDRIEEPGELWIVETVELNDPVWSRNPTVREILERRNPNSPGEAGMA